MEIREYIENGWRQKPHSNCAITSLRVPDQTMTAPYWYSLHLTQNVEVKLQLNVISASRASQEGFDDSPKFRETSCQFLNSTVDCSPFLRFFATDSSMLLDKFGCFVSYCYSLHLTQNAKVMLQLNVISASRASQERFNGSRKFRESSSYFLSSTVDCSPFLRKTKTANINAKNFTVYNAG